MKKKHGIKTYSNNDIIKIKKSCKQASYILDYIYNFLKPGITTNEINDLCYGKIIKFKAIPATLNYKYFPKSLCVSINNIVCHGIPNNRKLLDGDIINIDITININGWYGDTSRMYFIGNNISQEAYNLVRTTYYTMKKAIKEIETNMLLNNIGLTIENFINNTNYSIIKNYCGHGIGNKFHDLPNILHFYDDKYKFELKKGMCFTIEPMINIGRVNNIILPDKWAVSTKDLFLSSQFEHTIMVKHNKYEVLTFSSYENNIL